MPFIPFTFVFVSGETCLLSSAKAVPGSQTPWSQVDGEEGEAGNWAEISTVGKPFRL
jgi:hypothetical protein